MCQNLVQSRGELITLHVEGLQAFAGGLALGADNGRLGEGRSSNKYTAVDQPLSPITVLTNYVSFY